MLVLEFLRGAVRLHVLHHAAISEVHGAWMAEELARHGYRISPGTLYPTLHRMEAEGLLRSRSQVVAGRARRSYRATPKGRGVLEQAKEQLRELAHELLGPQRVIPSPRSGRAHAVSPGRSATGTPGVGSPERVP